MAKELITWEYTQGIAEAVGFKIYRNDTLIADVDITAREYEDDVTEIVDNATKFSDFQSIYKVRAYDIDDNISDDISKVKVVLLMDIFVDMENTTQPYNIVTISDDTFQGEKAHLLFNNKESYSIYSGGVITDSNWKIDITLSLDEANTIFGLGFLIGQKVDIGRIIDMTLKGYDNDDKSDIKTISLLKNINPKFRENENLLYPLIKETINTESLMIDDSIVIVEDGTLFDIDSTFTIINDDTVYSVVSIDNNNIEISPTITKSQSSFKKIEVLSNSALYKNYNFVINGNGVNGANISLINTLHLLGRNRK